MNLNEAFSGDLSKKEISRLAVLLGNEPDLLETVFEEILEKAPLPVVKQILWVLRTLSDQNPLLLNPWFENLLRTGERFPGNDTVWRNITGMWQVTDIPDVFEGRVYHLCLSFLQDQSAVAVKAFSMEVCYRIVCVYPELRAELTAVIEELMLKYREVSPAIASRGKKVLGKLRKSGFTPHSGKSYP